MMRIATVPVGGSPEDLAISPDGEEILVGNQADDTLTLIDAATNSNSLFALLPNNTNVRARLRFDF